MRRQAARASRLGLLALHFPSADGETSLVGYLCLHAGAGPHPALVLLHGRSGVYSSQAHAIGNRYVPYAPLLMLLASVDDELSPRVCERFAVQARAAGAPPELIIYDGAEHNFDDPSPTRQSRSANRRATEDARARAERFFRVHLGS